MNKILVSVLGVAMISAVSLVQGGDRVTAASASTRFALAHSFGDGTYRVGRDIAAGTYRSMGGSGCYWQRLKNFSGNLNGIIANDDAQGPAVVTIYRGDKGFETNNCGTWTSKLHRITKSKTKFGTGTYIVGMDVAPGTYRAGGGGNCYWERLRNFSGGLSGIIANDNPHGSVVVSIARSDHGFSSHGCGTWTRF